MLIRGRRLSLPVRRKVTRRRLILLAIALVVAVQVVSGFTKRTDTTPATNAAIDSYIAGQLADAGIPGGSVAIVRGGRLEHTAGFGAADWAGRQVTQDTPFVIGSLSKGLTAVAILRLADAGSVELDAPAVRYLPALETADPEASGAITIRQLLNQTSGLPASAVDLSAPVTSLDGEVDRLTAVQLAAQPGSRYEYANANYVVLGALIQKVTGRPYADAMDELVFRPLGMARTSADLATAVGNGLGDAHRLWFGLPDSHAPLFRPDIVPAGFITSTAPDLARVNQMILAGGRVNGEVFLSPSSISALTSGVGNPGPTGGRYAMGWVQTTIAGEPALYHDGSTTDESSVQILMPRRGLGLVLLTNGQSVLYELFQKTTTIGLSATERMAGLPPTGTLEGFYLVFDLAIVALFAVMLRGLFRAVKVARAADPGETRHGSAWTFGVRVLRLYLDFVVPLLILWRAPAFLAAPWWILVRIDVGLVLLVFAMLRLATGLVPLIGWARSRSRRGREQLPMAEEAGA
jgi:CubicO group peptidase (beta-lactamase class C family)